MQRLYLLVLVIAAAWLAAACAQRDGAGPDARIEAPPQARQAVDLPAPDTEGFIPLETAMASRRSVRSYGPEALSDAELGQLCWSAQGITEEGGRFRAAPSAGALYPLEVYVATDQALYHYSPEDHALGLVRGEDVRLDLQAAALGQEHVGQAPAVFIMTGVVSRLEVKYGDRSWQYMLLEAGHAAQNLLLQATTLELGACPVGAFEDDGLAGILGLDDGEAPLYLITVGTLG